MDLKVVKQRVFECTLQCRFPKDFHEKKVKP